MSIKRLLVDGVEIVCMCGAPTVYAAADMTVGIGVVATPLCPACEKRRADIMVYGELPAGYPEEACERLRAAKAVMQWLVGAGRFAKGVTADQIPAEMVAGATAWPSGAPVEVPLAETFAKAHAAWLQAHPQ